MFNRILVAYDGSAYAKPALLEAAELAHLSAAELYILGIVVTTGDSATAGAFGTDDGWGLAKDKLRQVLEVAALQHCSEVKEVTIATRDGDPANVIIEYANEIGADLAVLGHVERGVIARWFQGSTCESLLSHLPCNLLIAAGD